VGSQRECRGALVEPGVLRGDGGRACEEEEEYEELVCPELHRAVDRGHALREDCARKRRDDRGVGRGDGPGGAGLAQVGADLVCEGVGGAGSAGSVVAAYGELAPVAECAGVACGVGAEGPVKARFALGGVWEVLVPARAARVARGPLGVAAVKAWAAGSAREGVRRVGLGAQFAVWGGMNGARYYCEAERDDGELHASSAMAECGHGENK